MKKLISLFLISVMLVFAFTSCTTPDNDSGSKKIRIGYMAGPTGMGMAKLTHDNGGVDGNDDYSFKKYLNTGDAKADLAAGKIDVICLPTNEAAEYYEQFVGTIEVLSINCLNSLYLLSDKSTTISSLSDLNGKTIYTCKDGTPKSIIEYILAENDIDATVTYEYGDKTLVSPAQVGALVVTGELPIVVLPEPIITSSLLTIKSNGDTSIDYSVDLDLDDGWASAQGDSAMPITMGCIVVSKKFANNNPDLISAFLAEYKASIEFVGNSENIQTAADYIVEAQIMGAKPAAVKALTNLDGAIAYIDGAQMKSYLINFYNITGITPPDEKFYHK